MSLILKIALILFGLAYLISPVDAIPDLLVPYLGWLDDGAILACIYYLIRHGRLPPFLFGRAKSHLRGMGNRAHARQQADRSESAGGKKSRGDKGEGHQKSSGSPYDILGVRPSASRQEIQSAYKAAVKKYHPDKLSHLGEEFSNLANEKFLEIQEAYEQLMKTHRF